MRNKHKKTMQNRYYRIIKTSIIKSFLIWQINTKLNTKSQTDGESIIIKNAFTSSIFVVLYNTK
jgi:hypothetical protein